jgi:hypothetical protein
MRLIRWFQSLGGRGLATVVALLLVFSNAGAGYGAYVAGWNAVLPEARHWKSIANELEARALQAEADARLAAEREAAVRDELHQLQTSASVQALEQLRADYAKIQEWAQGLEAESKRKDGVIADLNRQVQELNGQVQQQQQQLRGQADTIAQYRAREGGRRKVVFVRGIDSDSTPAKDPFYNLKGSLVQLGYEQRDLLDFSYAGGELNGLGEYFPLPYHCSMTRQSVETNMGRLQALLHTYQSERPDVEIAVVGHSLGGFLAMHSNWQQSGKVVTVDSPLTGGLGRKLWLFNFFGCSGTDVLSDLSDTRIWKPFPADNVLNVANQHDCVYHPTECGSVVVLTAGLGIGCIGTGGWWCAGFLVPALLGKNDSEAQVVSGAQHFWSQRRERSGRFGIDGSHTASLNDPAVIARIVQFIGPPLRG